MSSAFKSNGTRSTTGSNTTLYLLTEMPSNGAGIENDRLVVIFCFLSLLALLIVMVNCVVVFLVWKKEILRTQANICLASLACLDLLSGLCVIPLVMGCTMAGTGNTARQVCIAMDVISRFLSISIVLHLLVIAIERYFVIVRFVTPGDVLTWRSCTAIVVIIWLVPLLASFIQFSWIHLASSEDNRLTRIEVTYDLVCVVGFAFFPLLVSIVAFTRIFCVLRRHGQDIAKQSAHLTPKFRPHRVKRKERRATFIYASMIVVYVIGWLPYFLLTLFHDSALLGIPVWANTIFMFCRFAASLINPVLYTFFKRDFREAIRSIRTGLEMEAEIRRPSSSRLNTLEHIALKKCAAPMSPGV